MKPASGKSDWTKTLGYVLLFLPLFLGLALILALSSKADRPVDEGILLPMIGAGLVGCISVFIGLFLVFRKV